MSKNIFFKNKIEYLTLKEVLEITNSKLVNDNINLEQKIFGISTLQKAQNNQISFLNSGTYLKELQNSQVGFCLVEDKYLEKIPQQITALINPNPYFAYSVLLDHFYEENIEIIQQIAPTAFIDETATLGKNITIMHGAYIGKNVKIGDDSIIGVNSVITDNVEIGKNALIKSLVNISHAKIADNIIIHPGVKIGQDGFGFAHNKGINKKIMQIGMVEIGNDVEIGANSCIDRGAIENTIIGNQVKLDNFVQIAHNVKIGDGTVIAGAACVAGSAIIGKFCQIGGSAAVAGHISVGDGAQIAGAAGVIKSVAAMQVVGGLPAVPIKDWHRMTLKLLKLIKK